MCSDRHPSPHSRGRRHGRTHRRSGLHWQGNNDWQSLSGVIQPSYNHDRNSTHDNDCTHNHNYGTRRSTHDNDGTHQHRYGTNCDVSCHGATDTLHRTNTCHLRRKCYWLVLPSRHDHVW